MVNSGCVSSSIDVEKKDGWQGWCQVRNDMIHGLGLSIETLCPTGGHQLIDGPLCGMWVIFASSIVERGNPYCLITYLKIDGKKDIQEMVHIHQ